MENDKKNKTAVKSRLQVFLIRSGVIVLLLLLSFSFFNTAMSGLIFRLSETGLNDFPAVWQDWSALGGLFLAGFLIHMAFAGIMHNLNLHPRKWPREE